ncbi:hypothetical protein FNH22_05550 [Fulvivirga sp. M361]|uniref:hypothetical protein n=1 Tax=Fulvivirga sp. M361 TaxID=2594266 RepID=UPI001179EC8C|nr:hypothetical protein [Fulvivirga sp. M361]TRX60515.1 hypothetical protein FNH22_05550 [Fulvivirga sp. M361]
MKSFYFRLLPFVVIIAASCASSGSVQSKLTSITDTVAIKHISPQVIKPRKVKLFFVHPHATRLTAALFVPGRPGSELYEQIYNDLKRLYSFRKYKPLWIHDRGPKPVFNELIRQWNMAESHGMDKEDYYFSTLLERVESLSFLDASVAELIQLDLDITANYLLFNYHIVNGRISPDKLNGHWFSDRKPIDLAKWLSTVNKPSTSTRYFNRLLPKRTEYKQMVAYLSFYRKIEKRGGWPGIPYKMLK